MKSILMGPFCAAMLLLAGCAAHEPVKSSPKAAEPAPEATVSTSSYDALLKEAAARPSPAFVGEGWQNLFDGKTMTGWHQTAFGGAGEVTIKNGLMVLDIGNPFNGVNYTNDTPHQNYEVALDAMRVSGSDFFCGLTVPVETNFCSLIVGGWGGSLVGISSLDGMDASENETTRIVNFEQGKWYRIRFRITTSKLQAWIDQERVADVDITDRRISVRPGDIEMSKPFGLANWQCMAAYRNIKLRLVAGPE